MKITESIKLIQEVLNTKAENIPNVVQDLICNYHEGMERCVEKLHMVQDLLAESLVTLKAVLNQISFGEAMENETISNLFHKATKLVDDHEYLQTHTANELMEVLFLCLNCQKHLYYIYEAGVFGDLSQLSIDDIFEKIRTVDISRVCD